eukprot:c25072_g1_i1 orf=449-1945(-)
MEMMAAPAPGAALDFSSKRRKVDENGGAGTAAVVPAAAVVGGGAGGSEVAIIPEDALKLLEHLSEEQRFEILQEATVRHYDVLEEVRKYADKDPVHRKIFVRGLGWDTNTDSLKNVFAQFGELEEGVVIMDRMTGKSRGYGFITFKHMDGALNALREPSKRIDGRMTVCQLASTGPAPTQPAQDLATRKIYVGNVPMDLPPDRLLNLFAQYGEIEEGPLGLDKQTGRSRGFALFIYKAQDAAQRALEEPVKILEGHQIFCKLAAEGQKPKLGAVQGQFDVSEMSMVQPGVAAPAAPTMQYSAMPQGMLTTGMTYNQGMAPSISPVINPAINPAMNSNLQPNLTVPNQNLGGATASLNPSVNAPVPSSSVTQVVNPGVSQTPPAIGMSSYSQNSYGQSSYGQHTGMIPYGSQVATYGGQPAPSYPGVGAATMYGVSQPPVTPVAPQVATMQGASQYTVPSYQNQQLNQQLTSSAAPRPPTVGSMPTVVSMPSVHPYYGT